MNKAAMSPEQLLAHGRAVLAKQPFSVLLGAELVALALDSTELRLPLRADLMQQHSFAHGGVVSYLADNALTFAGGIALTGQIVTAEMKINCVRPAVGELLIARAKVIGAGRRQAVVRCDVFAVKDGEEKLCAAAQGTIAAVPPREPVKEAE
jgi:uncharacterized protein (TIGR00369 family)